MGVFYMGLMTDDFKVWREDDCFYIQDLRQPWLFIHVVEAQALELRNKLSKVLSEREEIPTPQERLAWLPCPNIFGRTTDAAGEVVPHFCSTCQGTGLKYPQLSKPCPFHIPSEVYQEHCDVCKGRGRVEQYPSDVTPDLEAIRKLEAYPMLAKEAMLALCDEVERLEALVRQLADVLQMVAIYYPYSAWEVVREALAAYKAGQEEKP